MRTILIALAIAMAAVWAGGCKPAQRADTQSATDAADTGRPSVQADVTQDESPAQPASGPTASEVQSSIKAIAAQNLYAFITIYNGNDAAGPSMRQEVESIVNDRLSTRASFLSVDAASQDCTALMAQFGADPYALPLTVIIAPNGAITAGFAKEIPEEEKASDFSAALASPGMASVLLALQQGQLAAVCLQSEKTKHNAESLAAAEGLSADARLAAGAVTVIRIDPTDSAEARVLQVCSVDPNTPNAQLVIIAPPGRLVGKFDGAVTAESVVSAITQALSGAGGG